VTNRIHNGPQESPGDSTKTTAAFLHPFCGPQRVQSPFYKGKRSAAFGNTVDCWVRRLSLRREPQCPPGPSCVPLLSCS
jgi:hypothetical protein